METDGFNVGRCVDKGMEMNEDMRSFLMEDVFHLEDHEINKVKCIDGEIRMVNIINRDNILLTTPRFSSL